MNVLIAASYMAPQSGNFIASVIALGEVLHKCGGSMVCIFPESENARKENSWVHWLEENGHTVYLMDREQSDNQQLKQLQKIIHKHSIQILHTHFGMYHSIINRCRKALPVKILVHDHGTFNADRSMAKQRLSNFLQAAKYRALKVGMVSVNRKVDRSYAPAKHWYVPNGISLRRYVQQVKDRQQCRQELGIAPEEKVCLFLGWALRLKGLDIALKAIEECRKQDPSVTLGIVGVGVPPKEKAVKFIQESTGIAPDAPWIRYFPDTEDMFAYHRAVDVYLSASRWEGFSYGLLEAISQNTPVVVSDIEGTSWSKAYQHTYTYPVEDYKLCAGAIMQALKTGRTPSNAEEIVETYSIDAWCSQIIEIYNSL